MSKRTPTPVSGVNTVTFTGPAAPGGTRTARVSSDPSTPLLSISTELLPNCTDKAPTRLSPVMITVLVPPIGPAVSSRDLMSGSPW